jgi:uncharacterized tellurite resistance protein B-like protein
MQPGAPVKRVHAFPWAEYDRQRLIIEQRTDYPRRLFDQLIDFLTGSSSPAAGGVNQLQIAVAALLVQVALMDDQFEPAERAVIARLLAERFGLDSDAVARLMATAERKSEQSTQLYPFVRLLLERFDEIERVQMVEMLWEVAYADGVLHPDEDALIRRVGGLLYVSDHDRGTARKRVLQRRGLVEQNAKRTEGT